VLFAKQLGAGEESSLDLIVCLTTSTSSVASAVVRQYKSIAMKAAEAIIDANSGRYFRYCPSLPLQQTFPDHKNKYFLMFSKKHAQGSDKAQEDDLKCLWRFDPNDKTKSKPIKLHPRKNSKGILITADRLVKKFTFATKLNQKSHYWSVLKEPAGKKANKTLIEITLI